MQTHVDKIGRDIGEHRMFSGGVGNDERNIVFAQQRGKSFIVEAFVAHFDSVAQPLPSDFLRHGRGAHMRIVF